MDSRDRRRLATVSDAHALAQFLRARRRAVQPADVGLPTNGRRRVAGLRRDEVARLAGISVAYYQRLEQGRDRHPSEPVIRGIARALQLDPDAARYLRDLAGRRESGQQRRYSSTVAVNRGGTEAPKPGGDRRTTGPRSRSGANLSQTAAVSGLPWTRHTVTRVSFASDLNIGGRRGILVEGYSPLATGSILDNLAIGRKAAGYGKSVAQLSVPTSGGCLVIVGRFKHNRGILGFATKMRNVVRLDLLSRTTSLGESTPGHVLKLDIWMRRIAVDIA